MKRISQLGGSRFWSRVVKFHGRPLCCANMKRILVFLSTQTSGPGTKISCVTIWRDRLTDYGAEFSF